MTLQQAVRKVIDQNVSAGYNPSRFRQMTEYGNAENLEEVIKNVVMKAELFEDLEKAIKNHQDGVLTIEDLIMLEDDNFGFHADVVRQAKARSEHFSTIRESSLEELI